MIGQFRGLMLWSPLQLRICIFKKETLILVVTDGKKKKQQKWKDQTKRFIFKIFIGSVEF